MTAPELAQSLFNILLRLLLQHRATVAAAPREQDCVGSSSRRSSSDNLSTKSSTIQNPTSSSSAATVAGSESDIMSVFPHALLHISNGSDSKALASLASNNSIPDPGGQPVDGQQQNNNDGGIPNDDDNTNNPITHQIPCCLLERSSKEMSFVLPPQIAHLIASIGTRDERLGPLLIIPVTDTNDTSATSSPSPQNYNGNTPSYSESDDQTLSPESSVEEQLPESALKVNSDKRKSENPSNNKRVQRQQKEEPN